MPCRYVCCALLCLLSAFSLSPTSGAIPYKALADLASNSMCKTEVFYDENPERVPRIIKQVKCAASPDQMCLARGGGERYTSCCQQSSYLHVKFSCQEVIDTVLVQDTAGETSLKTVSIGCVCAKQESSEASETS